jgi:hypothetical protein
MSSIPFYANLDLGNLAQLLGARLHNVDNTSQTTLAGLLGAGNAGVVVYNTELQAILIWDGAQFVQQAIEVAGDIIFRGVLMEADYDGVAVGHPIAGSQYVIGEAGTLDIDGVSTYVPTAEVEIGDQILFTAPDTVYVIQRNDVQATEAALGNVRIATQAQANAGVDDTAALTSLKLATKLKAQQYVRGYNATVNLVALTPLNVNHGLNLPDRDAFTVNTMRNNQQVNVRIDSVDANNITLTSLTDLNNVKVTVMGFVNPA